MAGLFELDAGLLGLVDGQVYHYWFEVTQGRDVKTGRQDREPIVAWEAKAYRLVPGDNP